MENIIINFISDPAGLQPGIDALEQLEEKDKEVAKQAEKTMQAYAKRDKSIVDSTKGSKKSIDDLASSMKNLDKSLVGGIGRKALEDLRKNIKLTDAQWKTFYQNLIKNAKAELVSVKTKEDFEQLQQLIKGAEVALEKMAQKEELVNKTSKSMKAELRQLKQELQQLEDEGKENTAQFEKMAIKAGQLEDQIGDTNARIKALSSDTFVFDAMISGVTGLTGAFAAGQGVMALFGTESEEVQQALLKVNAAMSILQGLQAVQNVLQKQSAASIAIDLVLRRNQAAVTVAQTVATEAQAVATTQAAVAQRGLNLAFLSSPAGLIIGGIAAITAALFAFGSSSKKANDDLKVFNSNILLLDEVNKKAAESAGQEVGKLEALRAKLNDLRIPQRERVKYLEDYNRTADATNRVDATQINNLSLINSKISQQTQLIIKRAISTAALSKITEASTKAVEAQLNLQQQLTKFGAKESDKNKILADNAQLTRLRGNLASDEGSVESRRNLQSNQIKIGILSAAFQANETANAYLNSVTSMLERFIIPENTDAVVSNAANTVNEAAQKIDDTLQRNEKAQFDILKINLQRKIDFAKEEADNESNSLITRLAAAREYYNTKKELADAEFEYAKNSSSKTAKELELINEELGDKLVRIEKEFGEMRLAVKKSVADKLIEDEKRVSDALAEGIERRFRQWEAAEEARQKKIKEQGDKEAKEIEDREKRNIEIRDLALNSAINLSNILFNLNKRNYEQEAQSIRSLFDQKNISQTEYDNRVRALRRKQAADEKAQAVFSTLLQQGPIVLEGFTRGGFAGIAAAFTLFFTMLNAVTSTQVPAFRYGGEIDGPGTGTSDSVPVMASKGEFITRYEQTKKHKEALKAINEDRFDAYLMKYELPRMYSNMSATEMPLAAVTTSSGAGFEIDYDKMAEAFAGKLAENPQSILSIDEDGFRVSIRKGNTITDYKNKKLLN